MGMGVVRASGRRAGQGARQHGQADLLELLVVALLPELLRLLLELCHLGTRFLQGLHHWSHELAVRGGGNMSGESQLVRGVSGEASKTPLGAGDRYVRTHNAVA